MSLVLDKTPPSAIALSLSSLFLGLVTGYFLGSGASVGVFSSSSSSSSSSSKSKSHKSAYSASLTPKNQKSSWPNSYDVTVHADSSDEEEDGRQIQAADSTTSADENDHDHDHDSDSGSDDDNLDPGFPVASGSPGEDVKLVLVTRTDLGMTKGKIAAQCGHATLACYKSLLSSSSSSSPSLSLLRRWEGAGQPKIALQAKGGQEELETLQAQAVSLGLCARVIRDAGRTQIDPGTMTVLGILGPKSLVDQVTGQLKLL